MEKNTIIAVVLSTLVIIASFLLTNIFSGKNAAEANAITEQNAQAAENLSTETPSDFSIDNFEDGEPASLESATEKDAASEEKNVTEQQFVLKTDKIEAVFTNKGGDIISYK